MRPELKSVPSLAPGVRLTDGDRESKILLMPERALRLNGSSFQILRLCDGEHTVQAIAEKLQADYPKADPQRIMNDMLDYLASLHEERAIDFLS
jgi:pyrroloquinoline quinone biosynthesis protein D